MTVTASTLTYRGVPLPPDGSLLGYTVSQDVYSALLWFRYDGLPEPRWSVMPRAGEPWDQWPPFTGEKYFPASFWDHVEAGNIADVGPVIAANPGVVFWSAATRPLGADSCVVTADIAGEDGCVLRAGTYAWSQLLDDGTVLPGTGELLRGAVDIASRFRGQA